MIKIEVAYAVPDRQLILEVESSSEITIEEAIITSGILKEFPEIDMDGVAVGVFSKRKKLNDVLADGDRVEIYRPLTIDPKEARRERAKIKKE